MVGDYIVHGDVIREVASARFAPDSGLRVAIDLVTHSVDGQKSEATYTVPKEHTFNVLRVEILVRGK